MSEYDEQIRQIELAQQRKQQQNEQLRSILKDTHDISDAQNTLNNPYKRPVEKVYAIFNASSILGKYLIQFRNRFWRHF